MKSSDYVKLLTYPVAGAFSLGAVAPPPHHHDQAPGQHQTEIVAVPLWHSVHDHPDAPNRLPLPYVQVAPMSGMVAPNLNLTHYDELLQRFLG